jgi:hypothetical protein
MEDEAHPPAVLYAAKSTQDKHGSIPDQLADARAAAERDGRTVAGECSDEGFSAYSGNRGPGLRRAKDLAVRLAHSNGSAELWVQHSDRLARGGGLGRGDPQHLAETWFEMRRSGVAIRSVQDDHMLTDPAMVASIGQRNYEDSRRKGLAVSAGLKRRKRSGLHNGGTRRTGYQTVEKNGQLVIIESEAQTVRRIFGMYDAGQSQLGIARQLNDEGVLTIHGKPWRQCSVRSILANPFYKGYLRDGDDLVRGRHPAIVSTELWDSVERRRIAEARLPGKGRGRPPKAGHLFRRGILRCQHCGSAMVPRSEGRGTYYCLGRKERGTHYCPQSPIDRAWLDGAVFDHFLRAYVDLDASARELAAARSHRVEEIRVLALSADRDQIRVVENRARIRRDYRDGLITAEEWADLKSDLEPELEAATANLERLNAQLQEREQEAESEAVDRMFADIVLDMRRSIQRHLEGHDSLTIVRAVFARMFERIEVNVLDIQEVAKPVLVFVMRFRPEVLSENGRFEPARHSQILAVSDALLRTVAETTDAKLHKTP